MSQTSPTAQDHRDADPAGQPRRETRQRRALRARLFGAAEFVSAQQLYDDLRDRGEEVGLATIYRTLQAMSEAGEVDAVHHGDRGTLYRMCGTPTGCHHHLVCRGCGVAVELDGESVEHWADDAARDHGFTAVEHVVELFGLCAACSARGS